MFFCTVLEWYESTTDAGQRSSYSDALLEPRVSLFPFIRDSVWGLEHLACQGWSAEHALYGVAVSEHNSAPSLRSIVDTTDEALAVRTLRKRSVDSRWSRTQDYVVCRKIDVKVKIDVRP